MSNVEYPADGTVERRIGRRAPMIDLQVDWLVPRTGLFALGRRPREVPGSVLDASLTGAAISGPSSLPFEPGQTATIRYRGADSTVKVRRREHTEDALVHLFGVELAAAHPALLQHIGDTVDEAKRRSDAGPEAPSSGIVL